MYQTSNILQIAGKIDKVSAQASGVLSYAELSSIIASGSTVQNSRIISRLIRENVLTKIQRGFYTTKEFDIQLLASRIEPDCYISMDTVLADTAIIGTVPKRIISAVRIDKRKGRISTPLGDIVFHSVKRSLYFGIETKRNGVKKAVPEKAYLDLLYFYQKGARFVIDPLKEIDLSKLDKTLIKKFLVKYENPKFVKFVKGQIYGK